MINWKVRFSNKQFWIAFIPALLLLIQQVLNVFGIQADFVQLQQQLLGIVGTVFVLLVLFGIVNDPTTKGAGDSTEAQGYDKPKESLGR